MIESRIHRVVEESMGGSRVAQEILLRRRMQELTESSLGFPRGAVVISRRVVCGKVWPDLRARSHRPALGRIPSHADVVWFLDEAEYLACLLGAAASKELDGWWWRLAVGAIPTPVVVARLLRERGPVAREAVVRVVKAGLGPALAKWMGTVELPHFPAIQERADVEMGRHGLPREIPASRPIPGGDSRAHAVADVHGSSVPGPIPREGIEPRAALARKRDAASEATDPMRIEKTENGQPILSSVREGAGLVMGEERSSPPPLGPTVPAMEKAGEERPVSGRSVESARAQDAGATAWIADRSGDRSAEKPWRGEQKSEGVEVDSTCHIGRSDPWFAPGVDERGAISLLASRPPKAFTTEFGGHLFVLNALIAQGWFPDFTRPMDEGIVPSPWIALGMLGRRWFGKRFQSDRLSRWLEERDGACGFAESSVEREARLLEERIASGLGTPLRRALSLLCHRRAVVMDDGNRLVVRFALESHPLAIRLAGLDRDPGWMETGGRDVRFDFSMAGEA